MVDLNEDLMEALYDQEKVLIEDIEWEQETSNRSRYTTRARVMTVEGNEVLTLCGEKWTKGYSFVLRYQNTPIRVWDFNDHHDGIEGGHKHRYSNDGFRGDDPYSVDDVTTSDVNQALIDFLHECNIKTGDVNIQALTELQDYE